MIGLITRQRLYQRGSNVAWQWCYSVNGVSIGTNLAVATSWAKARGMKPVREWLRPAHQRAA